MRHFEENNILYELQYSFRKCKSCESQLISLLHDLAQNLDQGVQTDLISLISPRHLIQCPIIDFCTNSIGIELGRTFTLGLHLFLPMELRV